MYSFDARSDTLCVDEPLYAYYLTRHPHVYRVYRDEVINAQDSDGPTVLAKLEMRGEGVVFVKHMAKHAAGLDLSKYVGPQHAHILLFREPAGALLSYGARVADGTVGAVTFDELGCAQLVSIACQLGKAALCVESSRLTNSPRETLARVCEHCGIGFEESMLEWQAGPKNCDGLWAKYWYDGVHASSRFEPCTPVTKASRALDDAMYDLLEAATPFYQYLRRRAERIPPDALRLMPSPRNERILAWIGPPGAGTLVPRSAASVSAFDSAVQGGDACWEGLRVYHGRIFQLQQHLCRLFESAKMLGFRNCHSEDEVTAAIRSTLVANDMQDDVHIRLTLTRGLKCTSSMNPAFNVYGTTLIVLPEHKPVVSTVTYDNRAGVRLITSAQRRNPPQCLDSKIHHNNLLNNICAKLQANAAGCADAIMLDVDGYVAETNATNIFLVKRGQVATPLADHCLPGITRATIIDLICPELGLTCEQRRCSVAEFQAADEVFTTGTQGAITPVVEIDGRDIGDGKPGPVAIRIQQAYHALAVRDDLSVAIC